MDGKRRSRETKTEQVGRGGLKRQMEANKIGGSETKYVENISKYPNFRYLSEWKR